jgi:hypothetical protein
MRVEFENQEVGIPLGRVGTARKAGRSRVVPSLSSLNSIARNLSRLGRVLPHPLLHREGAKTGQIGASSSLENRPESASIGVFNVVLLRKAQKPLTLTFSRWEKE